MARFSAIAPATTCPAPRSPDPLCSPAALRLPARRRPPAHADRLLLHPARRQAQGLGEGVPDAARGDQGRRDRRRRGRARRSTASTTWRAPRSSRTRPSSTSSTAPSPPTSRASSCSPTSPRTFRSSGCRRSSSSSSRAEEKATIEKMGWDELMETLKKRFEEQKERHEGGNKMIGTGGTSPFGAYGYNPQGIRIGQDKGRNKSAVKVWDQRQFKDYDDSARARHAQHQGRAAPAAPLRARRLRGGARPRRHHPRAPRPTPAGSTSRWCPSATTR